MPSADEVPTTVAVARGQDASGTAQLPDASELAMAGTDDEADVGLIAQPASPTESLKRRNRAQSTIRRVVRVTSFLSQASFLPMAVDKVRNNVRSPALLVSVYVFAVLLVSAVVVLGLRQSDPTRMSFKTVVAPPANVRIAEPWSTFSVQLTDDEGAGLGGRDIYLSASPLEDVPLRVQVARGSVAVTGSVNCLEQMILPFGRGSLSLIPQCIPNSAGLLYPTKVETDIFGIATFSNVTLAAGFPGAYVFVITLDSSKEIFVTHFLNVEANNVSLSIDATAPELPRVVELRRPYNFSVFAEWSALRHPVPNSSVGLLPFPRVVAGSVAALELMSDGTTLAAPTAPIGPTGTTAGAIGAVSGTAVNSSIERFVVAAGDSASDTATANAPVIVRYRARLDFRNVVFYAANSLTLHIGVLCLGQAVPLRLNAHESPGMAPRNLITPSVIQTEVAAVFASVLPSSGGPYGPSVADDATTFNVTEGHPFVVRVRALAADGTALAGRIAFVRIELGNQSQTVALELVHDSPINNINVKRLIGQVNVSGTDATGTTEIYTRLTVMGAVAAYRLVATIDGVEAVFVADAELETIGTVARYNAATHDAKSIQCLSQSRAASIAMRLAPGYASQEETVAANWVMLPEVRIVDAAGTPLPGKYVGIVPDRSDPATRDADVVVLGASKISDDDGVGTFVHIAVMSTKREGSFRFLLVVDSLRQNFSRTIRWPSSTVRSYQLPGACAAVKPMWLPRNVFSNTGTSLVFAVVDIFGNPTTNGTVTQFVDPQAYADGGPRTSLPVVGGQVNISVNAPPVWRPAVLLATYACPAVSEDPTMSVAATQVALPVNPRVKSVALHIADMNTPEATAVVTVDAHWAAVTPSSPITVTAEPVWSPAFVRYYYPPERQVITRTVSVVGPDNATVSLTSDNRSPGTVWVVFVIDNFVTAINYPDTFEPGVARLELVRSAFNASMPTTVLHVMELTERPQVRLLGGRSSDSFVNDSFIFAQIGVVSAENASNVEWIEPASDPSKLDAAALSAVDDAGEPTNVVSAPSDALGLASLPRMLIAGSKAGLDLKIRYCYAADLLIQLANATTVTTVCVIEPTTIRIPPADELRITPLSPFVAAAPGGYVPELQVRLSWAQRPPAYALLDLPAFSFVIVMPSGGVPIRYLGGFSPTVASTNHTFTITGLVVDSAATTGAYAVDVIGPGCRTSFSVAVSAAPTKMLVVVQPSPRLFVGMYSVAVVIVQGVGGVPLPSKRVEMAVDRATDDCAGGGCGTLSPSSFTFGSTGSQGFFLGTFAVATAATGSYRLRFRVVDAPSSAATKQLTGAQIALFTFAMGLPRALMFEEVVRIDPRLVLTAGIINKMLDPDATSNAIGSNGGGAKSAASSSDSIEETFVRYFATADTGNRDAASALGMASSEMLNALSATAAEASTTEFFIENAVESIVVLQEPDVLVEYSVSTSAVNSLLSLDRKVQMTEHSAPRVQLLDKFGNPVPSTPVTFVAAPSGMTVEFPLAGIVSDDDGVASFAGTVVSSPVSGEFQLFFASRGSKGNATTVPIRFDITRRSSEETMKLFAFILCAGLSPMFLATVPHSWWVYGVFGSLFTLGLAVASTTLLATNWTDIVTNGFIYAYAVAGLLFVWVAAGGFIILAVVDVTSKLMRNRERDTHRDSSRLESLFKLVDVNREAYGAGILRYTTWLVNARVEYPEPAPELGRVGKLVAAFKQSATDRMENVSGKAQTTRQALTQHLIGDDDEEGGGKQSKHVTVQGADERPPLIQPKRVSDPTLFPPNLLVVMALAFALTLLLNFLAVHAVAVIRAFLNGLLGYLPRPADDENLEEINDTVTAAISVTFSALAASRPELAFLAAAVGPIKRLNIVSAAVTLRRLVQALEHRLDISSAVGLVVANLIVLASGVATLLHTKALIRHQRRWGGATLGPAFATPQVGRIETYIGLHCMHFVLVFVVVAALVFVVLLALLAEPVRLLLWEKGKVLLIASITSVAISLALRLFFVKLFLLDGWHIVRPEIHALFSFFDLVLGVFTGAVGTVVRWVQTVVFFTICFAKLDRPMFPFPFTSLDKAHVGFAAMVGAEANNSNPVYVTFAALLLLDRHVKAAVATEQLQREAAVSGGCDDGDRKPESLPNVMIQARSANLRHGWEHAIHGDGGGRLSDERDAIDRFECSNELQFVVAASDFADHRGISANVLNVMRASLRASAAHGVGNDCIDLAKSLRRRRMGRIANRWWLLLLLTRNPSLRSHRKCRVSAPPERTEDIELATQSSNTTVAA